MKLTLDLFRDVLSHRGVCTFLCRSHDVKNGGDLPHAAHSPGQSSPRPLLSQRGVSSKQAAPGFIGPQLPTHVLKVTRGEPVLSASQGRSARGCVLRLAAPAHSRTV